QKPPAPRRPRGPGAQRRRADVGTRGRGGAARLPRRHPRPAIRTRSPARRRAHRHARPGRQRVLPRLTGDLARPAPMLSERDPAGSLQEDAMALPGILRRPLTVPVVGAPMFIASGPTLVAAQCQAGIIGAFPALNARPASLLDEWLHRIGEENAAYADAHPD